MIDYNYTFEIKPSGNKFKPYNYKLMSTCIEFCGKPKRKNKKP